MELGTSDTGCMSSGPSFWSINGHGSHVRTLVGAILQSHLSIGSNLKYLHNAARHRAGPHHFSLLLVSVWGGIGAGLAPLGSHAFQHMSTNKSTSTPYVLKSSTGFVMYSYGIPGPSYVLCIHIMGFYVGITLSRLNKSLYMGSMPFWSTNHIDCSSCELRSISWIVQLLVPLQGFRVGRR